MRVSVKHRETHAHKTRSAIQPFDVVFRDPVLFITTHQHRIYLPAFSAYVAPQITGAEVAVRVDKGHSSYLEDAPLFNRTSMTFWVDALRKVAEGAIADIWLQK